MQPAIADWRAARGLLTVAALADDCTAAAEVATAIVQPAGLDRTKWGVVRSVWTAWCQAGARIEASLGNWANDEAAS